MLYYSSKARARCELREEANEDDARDVVEVMRFSMMDTFSDEFGLLDFKRSQHGSGSSNRSQVVFHLFSGFKILFENVVIVINREKCIKGKGKLV